jgi:hypothetical protein
VDDDAVDRYLRQRVPIPEPLRAHFGGAGEMPRAQAAATLSAAMQLRSDEQPALIVGLLLVMIEAVARAVPDGPRTPEDRGRAIADQALAHYTVDECLGISEYFGGDQVVIPTGTTLGTLADRVRELLGECLGEPLNGPLGRWSEQL